MKLYSKNHRSIKCLCFYEKLAKLESKYVCVNLTCVVLREHLSLPWLLNVIDMLLVRERPFKIHKFSSKIEFILIFSKAKKKKSGLKSTEVMPINPLLSDSGVRKGRIVKWQAPKKKSERAHLSDFDYSSPQPCLWFWKGGEYGEFCLSTDAKPSGQAGNRRVRWGVRQAWSNHENECKWRQGQPWEVQEHEEECT